MRLHNKITIKSPPPTRSNTIKVYSHIVRRTNTKNDKYISNKISASRKNTNVLLQHKNNKNHDINFNTESPNNTCKQIPTAYIERKFHTKTTIMENNGLYNTLINDNMSVSEITITKNNTG